jgi:small conductance mechanosensitive channel
MEEVSELAEYAPELMDQAVVYLPKFVFAIAVLIIGWIVIGWINRLIRMTIKKRKLDPSLAPFLSTLINWTLKLLLLISVIGMVGVQMTSFVAIVGAAGLAVGLSLQGTLANFAGGVVLLMLRPFKVGDVVNTKGYTGTVQEIQIFYTILHTFDKKVVYIPNGSLANADMVNFSPEEVRRNEWIFGIAYGDDVDKAKEVLHRLIREDDRILEEPAPFVAVHALADSSVNLVVRTWSKADDLWNVYFDMNENVYKTFPKEGLNIPFPQMDVHVQNK